MNDRNKKAITLFIGLLVAFLLTVLETRAQSAEGHIYGKVYTARTTYVGVIRWGGEEVFWTDLFNASKTDNSFKNYIPDKDRKEWWQEYDWSFSGIWKNSGSIHQFTCQFGNIKEMLNLRDDEVTIKLKNGATITLDGSGYNDIGGKVQVLDDELGVVNVAWDKIDRIEFLPTPATVDRVFGNPLYGTVEGARREKYTGYIVWDNDERLNSDKLDGDTEDGDVSFRFAEIESIEKDGNGCQVKLRSGRSIFLDDSNDVNDGNRGVLVVNPEFGVINFDWRAFRRVTFEKPTVDMQSYNQFATPNPLMGTVTLLEGGQVTGRIVYDVDEALDFEILEGRENDIEYQIPLRNIKRITPKNFDYSLVELRSGKTLLLGGMRDVSEGNSGVLVFTKGNKEPRHISWRKINEITFQ